MPLPFTRKDRRLAESQVAGGSAFFVRHQAAADFLAVDLSGDFGGSEADDDAAIGLIGFGLSR